MQLDHILKVYYALYLSLYLQARSQGTIKGFQLSFAVCLRWDKWQKSSFPISSRAAGARGAVAPRALCGTGGSGRARALLSPCGGASLAPSPCPVCRVLPTPARMKSLWFCSHTLGNSYPLQVPQCLLCLAFLTFLLRMCPKKKSGLTKSFLGGQRAAPSLPASSHPLLQRADRVTGPRRGE